VFSRDRLGRYRDRVPLKFEVRLSLDGKSWETVFTAPEGKSEEKDVTWDTAFAVYGKVNKVTR